MGDGESVRFERLGDERAVCADDILRPTHAVEFRMLPRLSSRKIRQSPKGEITVLGILCPEKRQKNGCHKWYPATTTKYGDFFLVRLRREQHIQGQLAMSFGYGTAVIDPALLRLSSNRPALGPASATPSTIGTRYGNMAPLSPLSPTCNMHDSWLLKPCSILLGPSLRGSRSQGACLWPCPNSEEVSHFRW